MDTPDTYKGWTITYHVFRPAYECYRAQKNGQIIRSGSRAALLKFIDAAEMKPKP